MFDTGWNAYQINIFDNLFDKQQPHQKPSKPPPEVKKQYRILYI